MDTTDEAEKSINAPTRTYVRDAKVMASTPADVKEYPNSFVFIIDMPGLKSGDIKVQVEDDKDGVLTVTVDKLPPPEPKKPKTIEVKIA
ncbi:hypothetical protein GH714_029586 [Hevea brasiliensis]|uniref:SHSP domain-containing protein n=1 Tax=Hevea brasiliensis TaxID=3981 RepID=A0A6A6LUX3_HEVBR|nr:hypothetical protein GH714_029586 [Hevea brasiliensis]